MTKIFISYRRSDTSGYAGRLHTTMKKAFGRKSVFMDLDGIHPGEEFAKKIEKAVGSCDYLLALIGDRWLSATDDEGKPRLDDKNDFVRREILSALAGNVEVIPVMVRKAEVPRAEDLPEPMRGLVSRQIHEISDSRWDFDVAQLIKAMGGGTRTYRFLKSKSLRVAGVMLALFLAFFVFISLLTKGASKAGEAFLTLLARGDLRAAYESTSAAYRSINDFQAFESRVTSLGLHDNADVSWHERQRATGGLTTLSGEVTTKQRTKLPLTLKLVKEEDAWKVASFGGEGGLKRTTPSEDALQRMVRADLLAFDRAVQASDFSAFYDRISKLWKKQTTAADLLEVFRGFVTHGITISEIESEQAIFDTAPVIGENDLLKLSGHYLLAERTVRFDLDYVFEDPEWKLIGIGVFPEGPEDPPTEDVTGLTEEALAALARESLLEIDRALRSGDFSTLFKKCSQKFRDQLSERDLVAGFQELVDQGRTLTGLNDAQLVFDSEHTISAFGELKLNGHFLVPDLKWEFSLSYLQEQSSWKLLSMSLKARDRPAE